MKHQLPEPGYVSSILGAMEAHPFATLSLVLVVALVVIGILVWKSK
jgi:hypothetical protein